MRSCIWYFCSDNFILPLFSSYLSVKFSYVCGSTWLSRCKIIYYTIFSWIYGFVGSCAHLAMVNSSWTQSHIEELWGIPYRTKRVYPPCDTSGLQVCNFLFFNLRILYAVWRWYAFFLYFLTLGFLFFIFQSKDFLFSVAFIFLF